MRTTHTIVLTSCLLACSGCATRSIWEEARNGNLNRVKKLIEDNPQLVNAPHKDAIAQDVDNRWTPLHYAVVHQHYKVVEYLLEKGANPLATSHSSWTPYHRSRNNRRLERTLRKAILDSGRQLP